MTEQPGTHDGDEQSDAQQSDAQQEQSTGVVVGDGDKVVVVTPNGMGIAETPSNTQGSAGEASDSDADQNAAEQRTPTELVEQPAKVMRIGSMVKSLLEEVRNAPLDDAGRSHLAQVHARSIAELKDGLAPELVDELDRIALPFSDDNPSDAELRIAQAQLVGWLEGLFHGIQTALVAQQMAAQAQLQQMRQLPPGMAHPGQVPPGARPQQAAATPSHEGTGQYL